MTGFPDRRTQCRILPGAKPAGLPALSRVEWWCRMRVMGTIREKVREILAELPPGVELVAAAKTRTPEEIREAMEAGVRIIGENYVQEAERAISVIGHGAQWHFIGHLQKNKIKKAVLLFDMIETVDSVEAAREIDRRCAQACKVMPVLIEVNSGRETQKAGVFPEAVEALVGEISTLPNVRVVGLMTMGPLAGEPEEARPCFRETRRVFERLKEQSPGGAEMRYLSMGMTSTYKIALQEGANLIRIGTRIFGERDYSR